MFGQTFAHGTLRKYVILFGTLFNDVWINRKDSDGNVLSTTTQTRTLADGTVKEID